MTEITLDQKIAALERACDMMEARHRESCNADYRMELGPHIISLRAILADYRKQQPDKAQWPKGARRTCDDGYPSCRMAEATGKWCFDVCLGARWF